MMRIVATLCALALLVVPTTAVALNPGDVTRELRCVECGTPLDVSNAPVAEQMKAQVRERIAQGWSKERILAEFEADFGREVLATPPKKGFDLIAWLLPLAVVLAGLTAIPFITRGWARRRGVAVGEPTELDAEDRTRLERELEEFDDG